MRLYFAGASKVEDDYPELQEQVTNRLVSYHYMTSSLEQFYYEDERSKYTRLMLDSGAFSAWSKGVPIAIEDYAAYCLKHLDKLDFIVNLDVIVGEPGGAVGAVGPERRADLEKGAAAGYENYHALIKAGVPKEKIIHVFHMDEDFKWLRKMVFEDKMEYIGFGGTVGRNSEDKTTWLQNCMNVIIDDNGLPIVKVHGFGLTSFDIINKYPFHSVDSSTWAVSAARGKYMVPQGTAATGWDFSKYPRTGTLSQIQGKSDHLNAGNIEGSLQLNNNKDRQHVIDYLTELNLSLGHTTYKRVHKDYKLQDKERFCTNSFIENMSMEAAPEGFERHGHLEDAVHVNKSRCTIEFDGDIADAKWVEIVHEIGAINYWKQRQYLNARFINLYVAHINKDEPLTYKKNNNTKSVEGACVLKGFDFCNPLQGDTE